MDHAGIRGNEESIDPSALQASRNVHASERTDVRPAWLRTAAEIFDNWSLVAATFGKAVRDNHADLGCQSVAAAGRVVTDCERRILLMGI